MANPIVRATVVQAAPVLFDTSRALQARASTSAGRTMRGAASWILHWETFPSSARSAKKRSHRDA